MQNEAEATSIHAKTTLFSANCALLLDFAFGYYTVIYLEIVKIIFNVAIKVNKSNIPKLKVCRFKRFELDF